MIIVAILKHVAGKSADYGAALDYLKYEHDKVLKKPLLDANGNRVLRRDILLEGINCEPELFDVECEMLNAQYHKNQNYDEIKTHHYLISFDPADKDECGTYNGNCSFCFRCAYICSLSKKKIEILFI